MRTTASNRTVAGNGVLLLTGLLLIALNLRLAIASVPPVLETIRHDLGLSRAILGFLSAIPVMCMSVFALVAPTINERIGARRGMLWSIVLIGAATATRLASTEAIVLFITAFFAGIGIAVAQSLLPTIVKNAFPYRSALITGLYTVGISGGAALAAFGTVPLKRFMDGFWPGALAFWALFAVVATVFWLPSVSHTAAAEESASQGTGGPLPWFSGRAWLVSLFFGLSCCLFYSTLTWLAPLYMDLGLTERHAGMLLTLFTLAQIPASFLIAASANRSNDRRPWLVLTLTLTVIGLGAVGMVPLVTPWIPWVWSTVLGIGIGGLFPLSLTLPLDNAADGEQAGRLTAMTFFVGYLLAALGPFAVGALRDVTGHYSLPFVALAVLGVVMLATSFRFRPLPPGNGGARAVCGDDR